jgi:hypothetical protein
MSRRGGGHRSFADADTHFEILPSGEGDDGYRRGEPKWLACSDCTARVKITRDPSDPSVEELPHDSDCPQRTVKSRWWWSQVSD